MIYFLEGKIAEIGENFAILEKGGVGFKILTNAESLKYLLLQGEAKFFCFPYVREETIELYGFREPETLKFFEMLIGISGVGPKTALGVLDIDKLPNIIAAIIEKKAELLTRTSGIGRKTAERIILELHAKLKMPKSGEIAKTMDLDGEVADVLVSLGYPLSHARKALSELGSEAKTLEERLKAALKALSGKSH